MEILRDGAALCALGPGETLLGGRTHRAAAIKIRRRGATGRKRSKKCYVGATVGALMLGKFLINWCARRDCFGACGPSSSASLRTAVATRRRPTRRRRRVVELGLLSAGSSNHNAERSQPTKGSQARKVMVRPERFE